MRFGTYRYHGEKDETCSCSFLSTTGRVDERVDCRCGEDDAGGEVTDNLGRIRREDT